LVLIRNHFKGGEIMKMELKPLRSRAFSLPFVRASECIGLTDEEIVLVEGA